MATILNTIKCVGIGANTGFGDCFFDPKNIVGGMYVRDSFELTASQLASPALALAALQAAAINDNENLRAYPFPEFDGLTDSTEDPVKQTLGYGNPSVVREGKYVLAFQFTKGGICVNNALRKFNGNKGKVILWDAEGTIIGTKVGTSLKGIPLTYFYARPFKLNDGSNVSLYTIEFSFNPNYINDNIAFIRLSLGDLSNIYGLQNAVLSLPIPRATAVIKAAVTKGCGGEDLYDTYSAELAVVGMWRATRNGAAVNISSVAIDPNLKAFTITLDTTDPDYNAAGPFVLNLAPVSVLTTGGVTGIEGKAIDVV